jgi:hypothetical protein
MREQVEPMVSMARERGWRRGCGGQRILLSRCGGGGRMRERPVMGSFLIEHTFIKPKDTIQRPVHIKVHSGWIHKTAVPPDKLHKDP